MARTLTLLLALVLSLHATEAHYSVDCVGATNIQHGFKDRTASRYKCFLGPSLEFSSGDGPPGMLRTPKLKCAQYDYLRDPIEALAGEHVTISYTATAGVTETRKVTSESGYLLLANQGQGMSADKAISEYCNHNNSADCRPMSKPFCDPDGVHCMYTFKVPSVVELGPLNIVAVWRTETTPGIVTGTGTSTSYFSSCFTVNIVKSKKAISKIPQPRTLTELNDERHLIAIMSKGAF